MLQDRDIVVMLQLRSKRVQEANRYQLFYHDNDGTTRFIRFQLAKSVIHLHLGV